MGLVEQAAKFYRGKQVIIVTTLLDSEGYLQEIAGRLNDAVDGCLIVEQKTSSTVDEVDDSENVIDEVDEVDDSENANPPNQVVAPTLVNADYVAWMYEETDEEEQDGEETY